MRYSDFAIDQTIKWLLETAMKNSISKRMAGRLYEIAEEMTQLRKDAQEAKQALEQQGQKCSFGVGVKVLLDGVHELDPCIYEEIERYRNVTVIVSKCKKCGNVDISWIRQENTEEVNYDEQEGANNEAYII